MPTQAAYPSILKTSGRNIVDANGFVMPRMKGFNIQVVPWAASNFTDMYTKGARVLRTVIFWDSLEPTQGNISSSYVANIDTHMARVQAAGLYTTIAFYYGPNGVHKPSWVPSSNLSSYASLGQNATQYLANRYGNPTSPQYTKAVIGFGINEPTPDSSSNTYLATHMAEQKTMMTWFRVSAPNWIGIISCGYGGGCPLPNVAGSGQTTQTFTGAVNDPFAGMGNWLMDLHVYKEATTSSTTKPVYDGRNAFGMPNSSVQIDVGANNYPPTGVTRTECQQFLGAYLASHGLYCGSTRANVPFIIGEWGWEPVHTGGDNFITDLAAASANIGSAMEIQWDYNTSSSSDPWAARPGGTWQTATNTWLASTSLGFNDSGSGTIRISGSRVEVFSGAKTQTGTFTFSGSGIDGYKTLTSFNDAPIGVLSFTGSRTEKLLIDYSDTPSGTMRFTGTSIENAPPAVNYDDPEIGSFTLSGSSVGSFSIIYNDSVGGFLNFSGSSVEASQSSTSYNDPVSGSIVLSGDASDFHTRQRKTGLSAATSVTLGLRPDVQRVLNLTANTEIALPLTPESA